VWIYRGALSMEESCHLIAGFRFLHGQIFALMRGLVRVQLAGAAGWTL